MPADQYASMEVLEATRNYKEFKKKIGKGKEALEIKAAIDLVGSLDNDRTLGWGYWILQCEHKKNATCSKNKPV